MAQSENVSPLLEILRKTAPDSTSADARDQQAKDQALKDQSQRRTFRKVSAILLFSVLAVELIYMGYIIYLQGNSNNSFHLNEWVFGLLVNGVLLQTFGLVRIIVLYSFEMQKS